MIDTLTNRTAAALTELIDALVAGYPQTETDEAEIATEIIQRVEAAFAHRAMADALFGNKARVYSAAADFDLATARDLANPEID